MIIFLIFLSSIILPSMFAQSPEAEWPCLTVKDASACKTFSEDCDWEIFEFPKPQIKREWFCNLLEHRNCKWEPRFRYCYNTSADAENICGEIQERRKCESKEYCKWTSLGCLNLNDEKYCESLSEENCFKNNKCILFFKANGKTDCLDYHQQQLMNCLLDENDYCSLEFECGKITDAERCKYFPEKCRWNQNNNACYENQFCVTMKDENSCKTFDENCQWNDNKICLNISQNCADIEKQALCKLLEYRNCKWSPKGEYCYNNTAETICEKAIEKEICELKEGCGWSALGYCFNVNDENVCESLSEENCFKNNKCIFFESVVGNKCLDYRNRLWLDLDCFRNERDCPLKFDCGKITDAKRCKYFRGQCSWDQINNTCGKFNFFCDMIKDENICKKKEYRGCKWSSQSGQCFNPMDINFCGDLKDEYMCEELKNRNCSWVRSSEYCYNWTAEGNPNDICVRFDNNKEGCFKNDECIFFNLTDHRNRGTTVCISYYDGDFSYSSCHYYDIDGKEYCIMAEEWGEECFWNNGRCYPKIECEMITDAKRCSYFSERCNWNQNEKKCHLIDERFCGKFTKQFCESNGCKWNEGVKACINHHLSLYDCRLVKPENCYGSKICSLIKSKKHCQGEAFTAQANLYNYCSQDTWNCNCLKPDYACVNEKKLFNYQGSVIGRGWFKNDYKGNEIGGGIIYFDELGNCYKRIEDADADDKKKNEELAGLYEEYTSAVEIQKPIFDCFDNFYEIALLPKCGHPHFDTLAYCWRAYHYDNVDFIKYMAKSDAEKGNKLLILLDGCFICKQKSDYFTANLTVKMDVFKAVGGNENNKVNVDNKTFVSIIEAGGNFMFAMQIESTSYSNLIFAIQHKCSNQMNEVTKNVFLRLDSAKKYPSRVILTRKISIELDSADVNYIKESGLPLIGEK